MDIKDITKDTKVSELAKTYPWLIDEVKRLSDRAAKLPAAMIKIILKNATINDIAKKTGETPETLINELGKLIKEHENV